MHGQRACRALPLSAYPAVVADDVGDCPQPAVVEPGTKTLTLPESAGILPRMPTVTHNARWWWTLSAEGVAG